MADYVPAYLDSAVAQALPEKQSYAMAMLRSCLACPRRCGVNRLTEQRGYCRTGRDALVSSAVAHHGEESCLSGTRGSGTIFFARCNLGCVFCQNWEISQGISGREMGKDSLAESMLHLQNQGCHNINLVTPSHVVPQIVEALVAAIDKGLRLPVVYNSGGYDGIDSLKMLEGLIDVYMPDFKFWSEETAARLAHAHDYPERARQAILEMHRQVGKLMIDEQGLAKHGVLVRHLVMPGLVHEARSILQWLARSVSVDTYVNIMSQYRPAHEVGRIGGAGDSLRTQHGEINRCPCGTEMAQARQYAVSVGLHRLD